MFLFFPVIFPVSRELDSGCLRKGQTRLVATIVAAAEPVSSYQSGNIKQMEATGRKHWRGKGLRG